MIQNSDLVSRARVKLLESIPSYAKEEYSLFIQFMKYYYEWSAREGADALFGTTKDNIDIDTAISSFLPMFQMNYFSDIPSKLVADKRLFFQHIIEIYKSKGTDNALNIFFRAVFDEPARKYFPREFLFRPSNDNWIVEKSILVSSTENLFPMEGSYVIGKTSHTKAFIERIEFSETMYRIYLSDIVGVFEKEDVFVGSLDGTIEYQFGEIDFSLAGLPYIEKTIIGISNSETNVFLRVNQVVRGSIESLTIVSPGTGYSVGDKILAISSSAGAGFEGEVLSVGGSGEITTTRIIRKGFNFDTEDVVIQIVSSGSGADITPIFTSGAFALKNVKFINNGNFNSSIPVVFSIDHGTIEVSPTIIHTSIRENGITSKPSNINRIIDSNFFQDFSYVISTGKSSAKNEAIIKQSLHPSGTKLFLETLIETNVQDSLSEFETSII